MEFAHRFRAVLLYGGLLALFTMAWPNQAAGQVMSFSVYTTGATNANIQTLYVYETVYDNSSCYSHSNYRTSITIRSPSGRTSFNQASALSVNGSIAINGEYGTYQSGISGTYTCGCTGLNLGFGFGIPLGISEAKTYYQNPQRSGLFGCYYSQTACSYGTPTCGLGGQVTLALYSTTLGCPYYAGAIYGVLRVNGGPPICTLGVSWAALGLGPCT